MASSDVVPPFDSPPFIGDQRVYRLAAAPPVRGDWLTADRLERRQYLDPKRDKAAAGRNPGEERLWVELAQREPVLNDPRIKRLCVLSDAGRGKTNLLRQYVYLRSTLPQFRDHLVFSFDFSEIPVAVLPSQQLPTFRDFLLTRLVNSIGITIHQAEQLFTRCLERPRVTLVIDAADQANTPPDRRQLPLEQAELLGRFVNQHPEVGLVLSGRPTALLDFWDVLFAQQRDSRGSDWEFLQVGEFEWPQIERYLGEEKARAIKKLDAETLSIPRSLEQVRHLTATELSHIRTRGELYWACIDRVLDLDFSHQNWFNPGFDRHHATFLLALLAFASLRAGIKGRLSGEKLDDFQFETFERYQKLILRKLSLPSSDALQKFKDYLGDLAKLNDFLDPGALKDGRSFHQPHRLNALQWNNGTTQAIFAALWVVRWADEDDRVWLGQAENLHTSETQTDSIRYEFWRFIVELPGKNPLTRHERPARDDDQFARALALLLDREDGVRSCEMLWRGWPEMLRLAGYPIASGDDGERQVNLATWRLAKEVHRAPHQDRSTMPTAKAILWEFLSEFPRLCLQRDGAGEIARSLRFDPERDGDSKSEEGQYCQCPPDGKAHTFVMGSPDGEFRYPDGSIPPAEQGRYENETPHVVTVSRFWLRKNVITNAEYELFDASHGSKRDKYSNNDNQPVLWVNWYEATMYSRWLGPGMQLPSEAQWEAACRAGTQTAYSFGDDASKLGKYTWWGGFSGGNCRKEPYAHEVGQKVPNEWGLHDMHGNVWEWCGDWYGAYDTSAGKDPMGPSSGSRRVGRGGSWRNNSARCRAADRDGGSSGLRYFSLGFRVALVPSSE